MTLRDELNAEITEAQRKLAILNSAPSDTFNLGTAVVFSAANGFKWYYVKTSEETWLDLRSGNAKDLASWILEAKDSAIGYFEVYELRPQPAPVYASA